jgi:hypothetical protein
MNRAAPAQTALLGAAFAVLAFSLGCGSATLIIPDSATTCIGQGGGTAYSADGAMTLRVPPGALAQMSCIVITTQHGVGLDHSNLLSEAYNLSPADLRFTLPAELSLAIDPVSITEARVAIATVDGGAPPIAIAAVVPPPATHLSGFVDGLTASRYGAVDLGDGCGVLSCNAPCKLCDVAQPDCGAAADGVCRADGVCVAPTGRECELAPNGSGDPPGTGRTFALNTFGAARPGIGFHLEGGCPAGNGCIQDELQVITSAFDIALAQGLISGQRNLVIELAGLTAPYEGAEDELTVKIYPAARDTAGAYRPLAAGLSGFPANASFQLPARIEGGHLASHGPYPLGLGAPANGAPADLVLVPSGVTTGTTAYLAIDFAQVTLDLPADLRGLTGGILGGVVRIHALATLEVDGQPLLERAAMAHLDPDIDLDGDGLERFVVDAGGRIQGCLDGDGSTVPPVDPAKPASCALRREMADGYSSAYEFSAVAQPFLVP